MYSIILFVVILAAFSWLYVGIFVSDIHIVLRVVMVVVGTLALIVMPRNDIYNPSTGETIFPPGVLEPTVPKGNVLLTIDNLPPSSLVVFWSDQYSGGVSQVSENGKAYITISCKEDCPVNRFGIDKKLPDFIYFRYELFDKPGVFSRIHSKEILAC